MGVLLNASLSGADMRRAVGAVTRNSSSVAGGGPQRRRALMASPATKTRAEPGSAASTLRAEEEQHLRQRALLAGRLSKATAYSRALEAQVEERDVALLRLHTAVLTLRRDIVALSEKAAKQAPSVESADAVLNLGLGIFQSVEELVETSEAHRARPVEIVWTGLAETVELHGSWNNWTRGQYLSPETSGTWTTWRASIMLLPGCYETKLLIDGEWRLGGDGWQTCGPDNSNNLLIVS